jgi:hypothetical protein
MVLRGEIMQANLEDAIKIIKNLPVEDYDKIRRVLDEGENANRTKNDNGEKSNWRMERYKKARKWLDKNSEKYMNQWVCLEGDKLIAHGDDALDIHKKAIEHGIESPFLHHIVKEPEFYMGGW